MNVFYLSKAKPIYLHNLFKLIVIEKFLSSLSLFLAESRLHSICSLGSVLQACLFQACEAAKPQDLAGFQLLDRGHVTCHGSPTERTVGVISFLVNIHPEVNLTPPHICFPSGVFLLLRYPHFVGRESFCSVTYPLQTTKNYFREAVFK